MHEWQAIEYCAGLICASTIHLKPFILAIAPNILGHTHLASPTERAICYRTLGHNLEARDLSEYGELRGERNVRSVISAVQSKDNFGNVKTPLKEVMVTTNFGIRESYHQTMKGRF